MRAPTLHRVVLSLSNQGAYLIMTHVHGSVLADIWPTLGLLRTLDKFFAPTIFPCLSGVGRIPSGNVCLL